MDRDFLIDLFADFGPVTIRPMFSGFGISVDGVNFAMALRAGLYFRADDVTIPQFEAEGSNPFQYQTRAKSRVGQFLLAIAGAAVRRHRGIERLGEGSAGCRAARGGEKRPKARAAEVGKPARKTPAKKKAARREDDGQSESARKRESGYATWLWVSAAYSGSTSQITRLRPLRLAA